MKNRLSTLFIFGFLFLGCSALAGEGHEEQSGTVTFRIGHAVVELSLEPPFYAPDAATDAVIRLKSHDTGAAIIDAEMYLLFDAEEGHAIAGHRQAMSHEAAPEGEMELDFDAPSASRPAVDLSTFSKLAPRQMAGTYAASFAPTRPGTYDFTLAVASIEGRIFEEPLLYGGGISHQPLSKAPARRMLLVMGVLLTSGLAAVMLMASRSSLGLRRGESLNLLDIGWVKRFFRSGWFQPLFQIPTIAVFIAIIVMGLAGTQEGDRNIATILTWTIWWAGIIFTFVLAGRVWCMMCPFGACQDWLGRRLSLDRNFPGPLRNIWLSTFLFLALTWWDAYSGIVNNPTFTAYLLLAFTAVSILTALIYKGRAFCRYICPIGGLIGVYSMFSPVELRNRRREVCGKDKEKGCIRGTSGSYPCPMFETPMTLDRNNYCNLCGECIKSCARDNIVLRGRSFARDLWASARGHMDEAYLIMALVGLTILATAEMIEPWHEWMDGLIKALPLAAVGVTSHVAQEEVAYTVLLVTISLVLPSLLLLLASAAVGLLAGAKSGMTIRNIFVRFSYMFIPVGLSMHLAHNVSHLLREGVLIVPAVQQTLITHAGMNLGVPDWDAAPLIGFEALFWLQMSTIVILNGFSLYAGYRIALRHFEGRALRSFVPMAILAIAFMLVNTYVLGQPMALRHTH